MRSCEGCGEAEEGMIIPSSLQRESRGRAFAL